MNKIETDASGRSSILLQNAPTEGQRALLTRRRMHLADSLSRASVADIADAILEMFYAWTDTRRMPTEKAAATAAKYAAGVEGLPMWAIAKACHDLTREDRDFPPSCGTFRSRAQAACRGVHDELANIRRILDAEVCRPTARGEDAKRRVRELAKTWKAA